MAPAEVAQRRAAGPARRHPLVGRHQACDQPGKSRVLRGRKPGERRQRQVEQRQPGLRRARQHEGLQPRDLEEQAWRRRGERFALAPAHLRVAIEQQAEHHRLGGQRLADRRHQLGRQPGHQLAGVFDVPLLELADRRLQRGRRLGRSRCWPGRSALTGALATGAGPGARCLTITSFSSGRCTISSIAAPTRPGPRRGFRRGAAPARCPGSSRGGCGRRPAGGSGIDRKPLPRPLAKKKWLASSAWPEAIFEPPAGGVAERAGGRPAGLRGEEAARPRRRPGTRAGATGPP